ncbi:MAG: alpha-L-arabinofuranosidase [Bacteroidota bacterium]
MKTCFPERYILSFTLMIVMIMFCSCKKKNSGPVEPPPPPPPPVTAKDTIPTDPATQASVGFFMDGWQPKNFVAPGTVTDQPLSAEATGVTVTVNTGQVLAKMPATYYGNNSNLWIGQLNNEPLLLTHLSNFQPRILRGPAGSVGDVFFFNALNNTPPADAPTEFVKADGTKEKSSFWYGKNNDTWTFSVDGYYDLLLKTNSVGLLTANYGYARYGTGPDPVAAAAHLAADWVRYDKGRTKYWEVGNENFGEWEAGYRINTSNNKDGQPEFITGALYGKHFKVFYDSMHKAATEVGSTIQVGALLYDSPPATWNTEAIKNWNSGVYAEAGNKPDFFSVHSYFTNFNENSNAATILTTASAVPVAIKNYVSAGITNAGLMQKPIAMTEWNLFASGSKQNVSHVAGMHAVIAISEFIKNGYGASLRWDLANGWSGGDDHGLFSLADEPGVAKWNPRPAFFHMYYFQKYTGDRMLASSVVGSNDIVSIASSFAGGQKGVILVNKSASSKTVDTKFLYFTPGNKFYYLMLNGDTDNGEFSRKVIVNGQGPANGIAGGPADKYETIKMFATPTVNGIRVTLPARSVVFMVVDKRE